VARRVLAGVALVGLTPAILQRAADLEPPGLRSLDAIHVATALELGRGLLALVTYDLRMFEAAGSLGVPVVAPA